MPEASGNSGHRPGWAEVSTPRCPGRRDHGERRPRRRLSLACLREEAKARSSVGGAGVWSRLPSGEDRSVPAHLCCVSCTFSRPRANPSPVLTGALGAVFPNGDRRLPTSPPHGARPSRAKGYAVLASWAQTSCFKTFGPISHQMGVCTSSRSAACWLGISDSARSSGDRS